MTMALDPNVGHLIKLMEQKIPTYTRHLLTLQLKLQVKLLSSQLTLPKLFHKVAIR